MDRLFFTWKTYVLLPIWCVQGVAWDGIGNSREVVAGFEQASFASEAVELPPWVTTASRIQQPSWPKACFGPRGV